MNKIVPISIETSKESRKSYLEQQLKKAKNRIKKYIREDDKTLLKLEENRVLDLEEQIKELDNE